MKQIVEFTDEGNWIQVYEEHRVIQVIDERSYTPIPTFEIGFLFDKHILAVRALSTKAKPHWRFAGNLYQRLQLGAGGTASNLPTVDLTNKGLYLNRVILLDLPQYTSTYELNFTPPHWIEDIRLTFWEYQGINSDNITESLNKLDAIQSDLARIESQQFTNNDNDPYTYT